MTNSEWLKYRSKVTGKSITELREEMKRSGALADRSKSGFAYLKQHNPEKLKEVTSKGGRNASKKKPQI
jgi:hypothetical protein